MGSEMTTFLKITSKMTMPSLSLIFIMMTTILSLTTSSSHREMTVEVMPGTEDCFFDVVEYGNSLTVEYIVLDGGHGDLDINFRIVSPDGSDVVNNVKSRNGIHKNHGVGAPGDYKVCLDNTFSFISSKTVYFKITNTEEKDDPIENNIGKTDIEYDLKVLDIDDTLRNIKLKISAALYLQKAKRMFDAKDRNLAENNFERVNFVSTVQVLFMICAGIVQLVMVKSLFDVHRTDRKSNGNLLKKLLRMFL